MQKPEMEWNRDTAHIVSMERCGPYFILGEASHLALVRNAEGQAVEAGKKAGELLRALGAAGRPVAAKLDGKAIDLESVVTCEGVLEPIFAESEEGLDIIRHSTAHLMAQAVEDRHRDIVFRRPRALDVLARIRKRADDGDAFETI